MSGRKITSSRTNEFIASFQIDGVCSTLQQLIASGTVPGPELRAMLKTLRDDFVNRCTGRGIDMIPAITETTAAGDLLAIAEVVRATSISFLTADEQEERQRIGFLSS